MAAIDFPASPSNGQTLSVGSIVYTYNSTKSRWEITSAGLEGAKGQKGQKGVKGQKGQGGTNGTNGTNGSKGQKGQTGGTVGGAIAMAIVFGY